MVPLDGSKRAERILPHVEELAHNFGSQVIFLHVVELPLVYTRIQGESSVNIEELTIEAMTHKAESNLAGLVGEFRENNYEVTNELYVRFMNEMFSSK